MKYSEFLALASKPMPYQWRVQSRTKDRSKAICTAYIDARDVMNRLDEIGLPWDSNVREVSGFIACSLTVMGEGWDVIKTDIGMRPETNEADQMYDQAGKSAYSDAFKRAAVQFGVGRFLYDLDMVTLPCDQYGNVVDERGQRVWDLTKHINAIGTKKQAPVVAPEPQHDAPAKPKLDQVKLDAMVQAIEDGKVDQVLAAMDKYTLSNAQRMALQGLIKSKLQGLIKSKKNK